MRYAKSVIFVVLVIALVPYLLASFCALPFADDFCFGWTASAKNGFWQKFLDQYLLWNGRYTADVLVNLHPLTTGSLLLYQSISCISIFSMGLAVFLLVKPWTKDLLSALLVVFFFLLYYLCYQPNITEGIYWYIGLVNYHWGNVIFILQLAVFCSLFTSNKWLLVRTLVSAVLLIAAIGFNEVGAAIIPVFYLAAFIYVKTIGGKRDNLSVCTRALLFHFAVAFIASAFVIFSPGNFTRSGEFPEQFHLIHSLLYASMQTARFIGRWILTVPFLALAFIVVAKADEACHLSVGKVDYRAWFVMLLFTVFMGAFLPYMATGILGQHRTMNYVFPFFLLLTLAALISFSERYQLYVLLGKYSKPGSIVMLASVALFFMTISPTTAGIVSGMQHHGFSNYKAAFMDRQSRILDSPVKHVEPLKNIPICFTVVDVKGDSAYWVDKCMKRFYTETGIIIH